MKPNRIFLFAVLFTLAIFMAACSEPVDNGGGGGGGSFLLTVTASGNGTVTSNDGQINCGSDCMQTYLDGVQVTLTATPDSGQTFSGWSGGCSGSDTTCVVDMTSAKTVTATFSGGSTGGGDGFLLQAFVSSGEGTLVSDVPGINCTSNPETDLSNCTETYPSGSSVTITATPATGFEVAAFGGSSCARSGNSCTYEMSKARDARVDFRPAGAVIIVSDSDDAEEYTTSNATFTAGTVDTTSTDLELNYDEGAGVNQLVGLRFVDVTPDASKTVSGAYIEFTPREGNASVVTLTIKAQGGNPATFTDTTNNISSRPLTSSSVTWMPGRWNKDEVSEETQTPDVYGLMNSAGWSAGESIVFVIDGDGSPEKRHAYSFGGDEDSAPRLIFTYDEED